MRDYPLSVVLAVAPPLRLKSQTTGVPKLQGVYRLKDEDGFPIDMSHELAQEQGAVVDWIEAMADAGRQCVFKFNGLLEEMRMLIGDEKTDQAERVFGMMLMPMPGEWFCDKASELHRRMWA